jgi:hypothetical protein
MTQTKMSLSSCSTRQNRSLVPLHRPDRWANVVTRLPLPSVDAFSERQTLKKNCGGALCTGADGPRAGPDGPRPGARRGGILCARADCPRPGAQLGFLCLTAGRSAPWGPDGPRVRRGGGSRRRRLDLAPGRDPVGEERS